MGLRTAVPLLAVCLASTIAVAAQAGPATPSRELLAMTPADFQRTAAIKDDSLEVLATITTQPGYQEKHGLLRMVWDDSFFRAFVGKTTGKTSYQLYQTILYAGRYYRYYDSVNYETEAGPVAVQTLDVQRAEDCSRSQYFGSRCVRLEHLAVPIHEAMLKAIAARYAPGAGDEAAWHFRFKAHAGEDYDGVIVPAEAAGLLAAVAEYKRAHGLDSRK